MQSWKRDSPLHLVGGGGGVEWGGIGGVSSGACGRDADLELSKMDTLIIQVSKVSRAIAEVRESCLCLEDLLSQEDKDQSALQSELQTPSGLTSLRLNQHTLTQANLQASIQLSKDHIEGEEQENQLLEEETAGLIKRLNDMKEAKRNKLQGIKDHYGGQLIGTETLQQQKKIIELNKQKDNLKTTLLQLRQDRNNKSATEWRNFVHSVVKMVQLQHNIEHDYKTLQQHEATIKLLQMTAESMKQQMGPTTTTITAPNTQHRNQCVFRGTPRTEAEAMDITAQYVSSPSRGRGSFTTSLSFIKLPMRFGKSIDNITRRQSSDSAMDTSVSPSAKDILVQSVLNPLNQSPDKLTVTTSITHSAVTSQAAAGDTSNPIIISDDADSTGSQVGPSSSRIKLGSVSLSGSSLSQTVAPFKLTQSSLSPMFSAFASNTPHTTNSLSSSVGSIAPTLITNSISHTPSVISSISHTPSVVNSISHTPSVVNSISHAVTSPTVGSPMLGTSFMPNNSPKSSPRPFSISPQLSRSLSMNPLKLRSMRGVPHRPRNAEVSPVKLLTSPHFRSMSRGPLSFGSTFPGVSQSSVSPSVSAPQPDLSFKSPCGSSPLMTVQETHMHQAYSEPSEKMIPTNSQFSEEGNLLPQDSNGHTVVGDDSTANSPPPPPLPPTTDSTQDTPLPMEVDSTEPPLEVEASILPSSQEFRLTENEETTQTQDGETDPTPHTEDDTVCFQDPPPEDTSQSFLDSTTVKAGDAPPVSKTPGTMNNKADGTMNNKTDVTIMDSRNYPSTTPQPSITPVSESPPNHSYPLSANPVSSITTNTSSTVPLYTSTHSINSSTSSIMSQSASPHFTATNPKALFQHSQPNSDLLRDSQTRPKASERFSSPVPVPDSDAFPFMFQGGPTQASSGSGGGTNPFSLFGSPVTDSPTPASSNNNFFSFGGPSTLRTDTPAPGLFNFSLGSDGGSVDHSDSSSFFSSLFDTSQSATANTSSDSSGFRLF